MFDLETTDLSTLEAVMETDKGQMVLRFNSDKAPGHVRNFLKLAQDGFYDGTAFHRIIKGFMIQGGCPNTKEGANGMPGTGGPGWNIDAEFNDIEHDRGILSMARSRDPNSAGSQFFLMHGRSEHLDNQYSAFGFVHEGLDVLDDIASSDVDYASSGERSQPTERIGLNTVTVRAIQEGAGDGEGDE